MLFVRGKGRDTQSLTLREKHTKFAAVRGDKRNGQRDTFPHMDLPPRGTHKCQVKFLLPYFLVSLYFYSFECNFFFVSLQPRSRCAEIIIVYVVIHILRVYPFWRGRKWKFNEIIFRKHVKLLYIFLIIFQLVTKKQPLLVWYTTYKRVAGS